MDPKTLKEGICYLCDSVLQMDSLNTRILSILKLKKKKKIQF